MNETHSDAFVFFGATGDLAFKKIFPSLQAMAGRGHLNVPVIGIGRSAPDLAAFKDRARESLEKRGGVDPAAFDKLMGSLRYVRGDNSDPPTYAALRKQLNGAQRPAFYLAIPPTMFATVVEQLGKAGCAGPGARVIVEKPFGTDLVSAQKLNAILERVLGDAMAGDATLFAREDYVEEAWRIVDPVLKAGTPVFEYNPKTWGPTEVENVTPAGGWHNPVLNGC